MIGVMKLAHILCVAASICPCLAEEPKKVSIQEFGGKVEVIGRVGAPLGKLVTIEGILVEGPFKGYEGGPTLRVQRVAGKYTQEDIRILVSPYALSKWGENIYPESKISLPKLEMGKTYRMEGYETGGYVGIPNEAYRRANLMLQTTGHYFRSHFVVIEGKTIEPIVASPGMFEESQALIEGTARTENGNRVVSGGDWTVIVARGEAWPADVEGKAVETLGFYMSTGQAKHFELLKGDWRLARLEDQVGRKVSLRGKPWSMNGQWWFDYRGQDVFVKDMKMLPGWKVDLHGEAIVLEGTLERVKDLTPDDTDFIKERSLKVDFMLRNPSWKPLPGLLAPESKPPPQPAKQDAPKTPPPRAKRK
jgi:hypothetical protein